MLFYFLFSFFNGFFLKQQVLNFSFNVLANYTEVIASVLDTLYIKRNDIDVDVKKKVVKGVLKFSRYPRVN